MFVGLTALALALLPFVARAQDENITAVTQVLQGAKVIPGIISDASDLKLLLETVFTTTNATFAVTAGANLTVDEVANSPNFSLQSNISAIANKPYLMVILDLDAPTPQNSNQSPFLHLLLQDVAAPNSTNGEFLLTNKSAHAPLAPYIAIAPPASSDPHRYVVLCYLQGQLGVTAPAGFNASDRTNFNISTFTSSVQGNNFTLVAATLFVVGANVTSSVKPNATLPDGALPTTTAPGNGSSSGSGSGSSGSGSSGNTGGAFGDNNALAKAIAWSMVGILTATGALLV